MKRYAIAAMASALMLCTGCAVFNRENTPAANWVEDSLLPEPGPARTVSYVVLIPVGLAAVTVDAVVIRPVTAPLRVSTALVVTVVP